MGMHQSFYVGYGLLVFIAITLNQPSITKPHLTEVTPLPLSSGTTDTLSCHTITARNPLGIELTPKWITVTH